MKLGLQSASASMFVLLGALVSGPARGIDVIVDFDPEVNFSEFRTLGWMEGTPAEDPEVERWIRVAVERELVGVGFKEAREEPDILVVTHASIESERLIDIQDYDYWQSFEGGNKETVAEEVWGSETGTILVDILDSESKKLIWRGVAKGIIAKKPEKRDHKINQVMARMFKGFPPKWKVEKSDAEKGD